MYTTTVSCSHLELRIDPAFYHPSHLMDVNNIMRFPVKRLDALRDNSARISYGVLKPRFEISSPYRMVRIQDFRDPFLDADSAVGINQNQFAEFHRSECIAGDILIAIAGYVGRAAIVPEFPFKLNINQHIARFRPSSTYNADPYYLVSYLLSSTGRRQLCRYVSGSVQTGINLEDLRELLIPQPDSFVQKYIGDKIRQAEQLRQISRVRSAYALRLVNTFLADENSAMNLEYEVAQLLDGEVLTDEYFQHIESKSARQPNQGRKSSRIQNIFLTTRLDCNFYNRDALELDRRFAQGYEVTTLGDVVDQARQITDGVRGPDLQPSMFKFVRLQDCAGWSIDFDNCLTISEAQFREHRRCQLQEGDVVVAIGGYIGHAAMARRVKPAVIGRHSAVLPMGANSKVDAGYLVAFLSSQAGAIQLQRYVSGTVQVGINLEDLRQIRLPLPSPVLQKHIGDAVRQADDCSYWASRLLSLACRLVEALIEGRITESELCEAYVASNQGDRQADRSILERMIVGGLDVPHESPLLPNLDGLYVAIDEAERGPTSGATSY
jgi:type I restriction enzyme S subunit